MTMSAGSDGGPPTSSSTPTNDTKSFLQPKKKKKKNPISLSLSLSLHRIEVIFCYFVCHYYWENIYIFIPTEIMPARFTSRDESGFLLLYRLQVPRSHDNSFNILCVTIIFHCTRALRFILNTCTEHMLIYIRILRAYDIGSTQQM